MPSDPRKLRPSELCRLLNSTPLGEVINERQIYRHRARAGTRIGDGKHVDLLRYLGWLLEVRHTPKPVPEGDPYERMKEKARARNVALADSRSDVDRKQGLEQNVDSSSLTKLHYPGIHPREKFPQAFHRRACAV